MVGSKINGSPAPLARNAPQGVSSRASFCNTSPGIKRDTQQDIASALSALRQAFRRDSGLDVTHIGRLAHHGQSILRHRAEAGVTQNFWATPALALLSSAAGFVANFRGVSSAAPSACLTAHDASSCSTGKVGTMRLKASLPVLSAIASRTVGKHIGAGADEPILSPQPSLIPDRLLAPGWMDHLDFSRFDDHAFLRECGQTIASTASPPACLHAAFKCFRPVFSAARSPLAISGMDSPRIALFFTRLLPALDLGVAPDQGLDPDFAQILFDRWFWSRAVSQGHKDHPFSIPNMLFGLMHSRADSNGSCPDAQPMQLRSLRDKLLMLLKVNSHDGAAQAKIWVLDAMLSMYEPTLVRSDVPPALRYGSVEWALLDIGIRAAGRQHWAYSHAELLGMAALIDPFSDTGERQTTLRESDLAAVGTVLRMAHAQRVIDLRVADVASALPVAVGLYRSQIETLAKSHSITELLTALPLRSDIAGSMLRENGLNPDAVFTIKRAGVLGDDLAGSQGRRMVGLDFDTPYSLSNILMSGGMKDLMNRGTSSALLLDVLSAGPDMLSPERLGRRFENEFDAAFEGFSDGIFNQALQSKVDELAADDAVFWRCGIATVAIPEVTLSAQISSASDPSGVHTWANMLRTRLNRYQATRGLLVAFDLVSQTGVERRSYRVTLEPLAVARYQGHVRDLLRENLPDFFEVGDRHNRVVSLNEIIGYAEFRNDAGNRSETQFVSRRLLEPISVAVKQAAYQKTGAEYSREAFHRTLLQLMPLGTCVGLGADEANWLDPLFCALDILTLIPVVGAGVKAAGAVQRLGSKLTTLQLQQLRFSLLSVPVPVEVAARNVAAVLDVGAPALDFAKQTAHWLNPLGGMTFLGERMSRIGIAALRRVESLPAMKRFAAGIKKKIAERAVFYPGEGFWQAVPGAVSAENGLRHIQYDGVTYGLIDMGTRRDILVLQHGADLRLANPETGLAFGPPLAPAVSLRVGGRGPSRIDGSECRARRAGAAVSAGGCMRLLALPRFGAYAARIRRRSSFLMLQARRVAGNRKAIHLVKIDLDMNGVSAYRMRGDERFEFSPYFAHDGRIWKETKNILSETSVVFDAPDRVWAELVHTPVVGGLGREDDWYLATTLALPYLADDADLYYNRFTVPFANYPGPGGECMGIAVIAEVPYQFELAKDWQKLPDQNRRLELTKATNENLNIFDQFQMINRFKPPDSFLSETIRQFKLADVSLRGRLDMVIQRVENLLDSATRSLRGKGAVGNFIIERFVPEHWDDTRITLFTATVIKNIAELRTCLSMLIRHRYQIVGLGHARITKIMRPGEIPYKLVDDAVSYRGALAMDMDLSHLQVPLILFSEAHFSSAPVDRLAADLIHELTHARYASRDTMSIFQKEDVYPLTMGNQIDITPLLRAAAEDGSDSANHASTVEQIIVLLAYARAESTSALVDEIRAGGSCFSYKEEDPVTITCFGATCAVSRLG